MFHHEVAKENTKGSDAALSTSATDVTPPSSPSIAASPYWGESTAPVQPEGFSPFVGFCFCINYILGTGFLTVPWAFSQGGLILSAFVIIVVGVFSDISKNFLLETIARAEAMLDNRMHWIKRNPGDEEKGQLIYSPMIMMQNNDNTTSGETANLLKQSPALNKMYDSTKLTHGAGGSSGRLLSLSQPSTPGPSLPGTPGTSQPGTPNTSRHGGRRLIHRPPPKYLIKHRKFEVNSLCRVFVGKSGLRIYTAFICLYIYCTLWAYTSVFASALAKAAPIFFGGNLDTNYLVYAIIFAVLVVPMSCMELHEQVAVQVTMTGARFVMLALMLSTAGLCAQDNANNGEIFQEAPMFRPSGIDKMLPIMVFAHIYHHSIPGLAHPVANKKQLSGMFRSTIVFSTVAYAFIGLVLASAFGTGIEQSSNLNWKGFTGGTAVVNGDGVVISIAWWAKAISLYVLLFPALDVVSAFPLNAITLGNNIMGSVYGKRIHEVEHNRSIVVRFRLLASIPPIIFGILERKLGTITDYAGTTGFIIGFSFPALLYIRSRAAAKRKHFSTSTFYSSYSSSTQIGWALFYFGLLMVVYVVFCLVRGGGEE